MKSSEKVVLVLLMVVALSATTISPAAAAPAAQAPALAVPALRCGGGTCQFVGDAPGPLGLLQLGANLALLGAPFETTADGGTQATLDAKKDITLSLPVGEVTLTNARLQVEVGQDGTITRLNGSADMPFPTFGLLDDTRVVAPARADVGLDLGKNLPDVGVQLEPDRPYLFFNANSFLSVAGRTLGGADEVSLDFTPGQRLTLVLDTVESVAYLNGQATLSVTDQLALLGGVLENTPAGPYVPDTLPLRERTQYGLVGKFSKELAESRLTLKGGYMLDAGFLPAQLGVDAELVKVVGELTIRRDGALVNGVLRSSIEPDKVFDGTIEVVTFIPFTPAAGPGYASVDAGMRVPAARLGVGAGARASAGKYELNGRLATPFRDSDLAGRVSGRLPDVAGTVGPALNQAGHAVGSAAGTVGSAAGRAGETVGAAASSAAGSVRSAAENASVGVGAGIRKAGDVVRPAVNKAKDIVGSAVRSGLRSAGDAFEAGKARLN